MRLAKSPAGDQHAEAFRATKDLPLRALEYDHHAASFSTVTTKSGITAGRVSEVRASSQRVLRFRKSIVTVGCLSAPDLWGAHARYSQVLMPEHRREAERR